MNNPETKAKPTDTPETDTEESFYDYSIIPKERHYSVDAEFARKLERQRDALKTSMRKILLIAEHGMPMPSHSGPCGPWAQCDGDCQGHAYCAEDMIEALKLIEPNAEVSDSGLGKPTISGQTAAPAVRLH